MAAVIMVLRVILLVLILATSARVSWATNRCLDCHRVHLAGQASCTGCHRGDNEATRPALAHHRLLRGAAAAWSIPNSAVLVRGTALRDSLACRRCHLTGGKGERLATNLDMVVRQRSQDQLRGALLQPASAMPRFGLTRAQADTLIALLLHDGTDATEKPRYRVNFRDAPIDTLPVFTRLCGSCHRALSPGGPLGSGQDGPDLSGLTGDFYPRDDGEKWTAERLAHWLANPRRLRPETTMPPLAVTPAEVQTILKELDSRPHL